LKRYDLFLEEAQLRSLQVLSKNKATSVSLLIRQALDDFISKQHSMDLEWEDLTPEKMAEQAGMRRVIGLQ